MNKTAVGMYHTFIYDTTIGADCNYAQKTHKLWTTQQKDGIVKQITSIRDRLDGWLKRIADE